MIKILNKRILNRGDNHAEKSSYITALLCFGIGNLCFADSSRMLDKNTELHPQGWSVGETIKFKKKTAVRLNDIGEVISGTLADDTYLRPHGWQRIINDNYFVSAYTGGAWFPRHHRYWPGSVYNIALPSYGICVIRMTPPLLLVNRARF